MSSKKRILSAIQPSGNLTLGNYLGSILSWKQFQNDYDCVFFIADLHTITVRQDPENFRKNIFNLYALLISCGVDLDKCIFFVQSHVHEHSELAWILNCFSPVGELSRMTQFKDKSKKYEENVNAGLLTYPSLMAGDILLYDTDLVPVGQDQKQHIEFTRNLAIRFNGIYGDTFVIPDGFIPKVGSKIMSLSDPTKKMSKSGEESSCINILDDPALIIKKIKRSVTDSGSEVRFNHNEKTGINNLMTIYSSLRKISLDEVESNFVGKGYGQFKKEVSEAIIDEFTPIQKKFNDMANNKDFIFKQFKINADKARNISSKKLQLVKKLIGFI